MVINKLITVAQWRPAIILRCAQVILIPDDNKITVFKKGKPQGFKTVIPYGGQIAPIAIDGIKLEWKKAQKNAKKNIISDKINKSIPWRKPKRTFFVWFPSKVASIIISENQRYKQKHKQKKEKNILINPASRHKCI